MAVGNTSTSAATHTGELELVSTRVFDAPRDPVFKAWTELERLIRWWGPNGFTTQQDQVAQRPPLLHIGFVIDAAPTCQGSFWLGLRRRPIMTYALWIVQGLLALLFLFAGGMKLVMPLEALTSEMPLPGLFVRCIGVAEVLGAIGLILPGLLRIRPGLTPLAATGLVLIMIGATVLTLASGAVAQALIPLGVGILAAFVAYGRWRLVPHRRPTNFRDPYSRSRATGA
jgi:hypothetical protein